MNLVKRKGEFGLLKVNCSTSSENLFRNYIVRYIDPNKEFDPTMNQTKLSVAYGSIMCLVWLIFFPVAVYSLFVIYKDRRKLYLLKRRPILVYLAVAGLTICQFSM